MTHAKKPLIHNKETKNYTLVSVIIILLLLINIPPLTSIADTTPQCPTSPLFDDSEQHQRSNQDDTIRTTLPWWDANWHYRVIYDVTGVGNLSVSLNFTSILHSLQVYNKTFENNTITIVQSSANGTMIVVNTTCFNETTTYHNRTNAQGHLIWQISTPSKYVVYFDVQENNGTRTPTVETPNMTASGTTQATLLATQGWWSEFVHPFKTYYPVGTDLEIRVRTSAKAANLTAQFSRDNQIKFNRTLRTMDNELWLNTSTALSTGYWTVTILGSDDAGYRNTSLNAGFYIGTPDLAVTSLSLTPAQAYVGYSVTIAATIKSFNATVPGVNVSFRINGVQKDALKNLTFQKDQTSTIQFNWLFSTKGVYNVSVTIDFTDLNASNNKKWKVIQVEGVPDIKVLSISVDPTIVSEGNPVAITTHLTNIGDGNATNYEILLYCQQTQSNQTILSAVRNQTKFNLKKNDHMNITLIWQKTTYGPVRFNGQWAVGIEILNTTLTPDKNEDDNYKAQFNAFRVIPSEQKPPLLSNLQYPQTVEQGYPALFGIKATDESGIDTVVISIKTPNKTFVNATMTAKPNNQYEYLFDALQVGKHNFTIKATDLSPFKNSTVVTGSFTVTVDKTPPTIIYAGAIPFVQLKDGEVEIRCITTDFSGIKSVNTTIRYPLNYSQTYLMTNASDDPKYVSIRSYTDYGKYLYVVTVQDKANNIITTQEKSFWITNDLNDTDMDGMPDAWELRYGFDPYDPSDALQDADGDGVTNLEEYRAGTNPRKKLSSSSELLENIKQNWGYIIASVFLCLFILLLVYYYGIRRKKR